MATTFSAILTAHLIGYLLFQAKWPLAPRRQIWPLALHAVLVALAAYLLLGAFRWQILLVIFLTHLVMDVIEVYSRTHSLASLLAGHSVHLAVLLVLAYCFPAATDGGWWIAALKPELANWYFASLTIISGLILCVRVGGDLIARVTRRFADELRENDFVGLKQGGQYIGWLERFLVMLLLLMDQPNGIGFLIAAKSILRFGEIKNPSQRMVAEYIIIGTFLSFGWALLVSVLTQRALRYWMP